MQVMASPVADTTPLDNDATRIAQADTMAVDAKANGIHLPSPESAMKLETSNEIAPVTKPTTNGDHAPMDASAKPVEHVSSGIDGVAQFLPDHAADNASLFGDTDTSATVTAAVEAPTSDVREEPATAEELSNATQATSESTQNVPETQLDSAAPAEPDAMDTSFGGESDTKSQGPSAPPTKPMNDLKIETGADATLPQSDLNQSPAIIDREMEDAPSTGKVRPREDDEDEVPDAKRTKTEDEVTLPAEFKSLDAPSQPAPATQTNGSQATPTTPAPAPTEGAPAESGVHKAVDYESWPTAPMTDAQNKFLLERIRNTKKIKVSAAFKDPVNPVALNIPTYPDIVKKPMDLSTMENKLKEKKYDLIADFMADLDQMVENSELFNNKQHPVTQAGYNLRAYFLKGMGKMPRGGADEMAKPKAKKPAPPAAPKPRRESRVVPPTVKSPVAAAPAATSPQAAWPLQQDGTPLIRRDSSTADGRPKREIHRPTKDLPYANAKPKRKKFAQELKFCESVLTELLKPKYQPVSFPFIVPVDPVALNIPSYLTIIKKPMDFGTIQKNLKNGMYQNAKEFYNDAQLVFKNCFKFNPPDEPVHKMGKQLEDIFESLWKEKDDWIHQHTAVEHSHSDHYSDDEDEEDEEEEEVDPGQAQILAIQQQIAQLNAAAQQLLQAQQSGKRASPNAPGKKKKKKGAAAPTKRKSLPLNVPPPVKSSKQQKKAKAPAPLTFAQKQEISDGISTLGDSDMRRAVQIIRNGVPHLANVHDDEMELDMDEINDETLRELFKFIKSIRGGQKAGAVLVDDEDFKPPSAVPKHTGTSRPKKNKPMGKTEQEDNMRKIQEKLQSFAGGASGSSQSPPAHDASSDDDESSGSESEEE